MAIIDYLNEDFNILSCEIVIGDGDYNNPIIINNPVVIREVKDIVINDTYKKLINTADVVFPKGSILEGDIIMNITSDGRDSRNIIHRSENNDFIYTEMRDDGVVVEKTTTQSLINEDSVRLGQRISIRLGYDGDIKSMFEGYIVSISSEDEVVLHCENMAYILKTKQAPNVHIPASKGNVNDICGEQYGLLKGTGFELHPDTINSNIQVGEIDIIDQLTVADVFNSWSRAGIHTFLKYDDSDRMSMPKIAVARPYSSANREINENPMQTAYPIYFDYHVASNNLTYSKSDPMFMAVQGTGLMSNGRFFKLYVRKNPEYNPNDPSSKKYQVVNATQFSKKQQKRTGNKTATGAETRTKVDLSTYNIIPYVSRTPNVTSDQLRDECITWFETYEKNGVEGSLVIFGDYGLSSASLVNLIDNINSDKNGIYIVEEVTTNFGVNGYRQTLKIPYRVKKM